VRRQLASWSWRIIDRIDRAIAMVERAVVGLVGRLAALGVGSYWLPWSSSLWSA
jgi:hypothetical protein